jgi:hypothetical protein
LFIVIKATFSTRQIGHDSFYTATARIQHGQRGIAGEQHGLWL